MKQKWLDEGKGGGVKEKRKRGMKGWSDKEMDGGRITDDYETFS